MAEKQGYSSASAVVGPYSEKAFTLRLDPLSVPLAASSSLSIVTDAAMAASVSLDGKPVGDLLTQQVLLSKLAEGTHDVSISENGSTLELTIEVSPHGILKVDEVHGLDQRPVIVMTQNGTSQEILCRCDDAEIRIDGKRVKPLGSGRYGVPGKAVAEHEVTLIRHGQSERIPLLGTDPKYGMIFIASGQAPPEPPKVHPDEQAWEPIKDSRDLSALLQFRATFPQSPYARIAYLRCSDLSWETIRNSTKVSDFQSYVNSYQDSTHAQEAKDRIAALTPKSPPPVINQSPSVPPDLAAWNNIKNSRDLNVLRDFRAQYPASPYAKSAYELMTDIEWNSVKNSQDMGALKSFREQHPDSKYDAQAFQRMADVAWDAISGSSQTEVLEGFVKEYPGTPHVAEANVRIKVLKDQHDRKAIQDTLEEYRSAYERKDLSSLTKIWPNLPRAFSKQFAGVDKIRVTLNCGDPQIDGDAATVSCKQMTEFVAHGKTNPFQDPRLFRLRRDQGRWVIEKDN